MNIVISEKDSIEKAKIIYEDLKKATKNFELLINQEKQKSNKKIINTLICHPLALLHNVMLTSIIIWVLLLTHLEINAPFNASFSFLISISSLNFLLFVIYSFAIYHIPLSFF